MVESVTCNGCGTRHVLVGGVGAGTDKTDLQVLRPVVVLDSLLELGDWSGKIWSEWTVDVWLKLVKVDLDQGVVLGTLIFTELLSV